MLERRKFLTRVRSLGMGLAFGLMEYSRSWVNNCPEGVGHEAAAVTDRASDKQAELENLLAVEGWEDLLDDVDCATVVRRYVHLEEEHASLFRFRGRCPFCQMQSLGIYEYEDSFFCEACEVGGTAVEFLCQIERLPYAEAVRLARRLLHSGSFQEKREGQKKWLKMVEEVVLWSHHLLLNDSEGSVARNWLRERGISSAVWD